MVGINAIAAFAGLWIKKFISEKTIKWIGGIIFVLFGLVTLFGIILK